jgi:hypothetical protein
VKFADTLGIDLHFAGDIVAQALIDARGRRAAVSQ